MIYIVVLNWKGASDTIFCYDSIMKLEAVNFSYNLIVCDNDSPDGSYDVIKEHISRTCQQHGRTLILLSQDDIGLNCKEHLGVNKVFLIKNSSNRGYAAGNNVGINLAMQDPDCRYVWILNNDTEVTPSSLHFLYDYCQQNKQVGICGSRLVYFHDRTKMQGLGGVFNPWLGCTHHYMSSYPSNMVVDNNAVQSCIDYVIGASLFIRRELIDDIGLLCEDYFLYFEELDYSSRAKSKGYINGICSESIVYHKEGASTDKGRSPLADFYSVRNRFVYIRKYFTLQYVICAITIPLIFLNRLRRFEIIKAKNIIKILKHVFSSSLAALKYHE